ncbi:MAG: 30S ribosomal protein S17 [Parcubacteria group bacterium GW2011_GWC1_45_9]|nr:MAG: 30S ribosomal protein S17 [Parcubacteria group bacterium GW2011_GWA1_Parcubacteria_45_10]KKT88470.1 MAG: 30S ribosomal protein S17 [Parcubacteria group bacterium GW2011_GWB1_45_10]KKU17306.1 MAG: 30S ribosomal protein S17 [Parcubacteria group bacterium GW2011_GWC1_45_9]HCI05213.1 30S ribosomal protein S17 [Patescibacteria group bacterium]
MEKKSKKRKLSGEVVSAKMQKTAVVVVKRVKTHPLYHKRMVLSSRFKAENPDNKFREGDYVVIEETRPMSKGKRWLIIGKTKQLI